MTVPSPGSRIEIDVDALRHNVRALRKEFAPATMVMVVKADAYGHGVDPIVPKAIEYGVEEFSVFSAHEASHVLAVAPDARVQVMGHAGRQWEWVAKAGVEPWINDIAEWPTALQAARAHVAEGGEPMQVHVELETGMHRTGLIPDNAIGIIEEAASNDSVVVRGLCTHLAGAEDERNRDRIDAQLAIFHDVEETIHDAGLPMPLRHVASSSAALVHPEWRKDMVRVGIASYGMWPTPEIRSRYQRSGGDLHLERVLAWRSQIMAVQDVAAGEFIGYGKSHCATRDTRIAVVPVGYGDGLTRRLSNAGHLLVGGTRCPIVGPVNMNMVQIDVGHLGEVEPGEPVTLIGRQGDEEIGIHSFAEAQEVVDYEFVARLSQDIPRRPT